MIRPCPRVRRPSRRGAIVVLAAILAVVMLGVVAFALDLGYVLLVRTQLQAAADSSALAAAASANLTRGEMEGVAKQYAGYHQAAGRAVQLNSPDIEYGNWDTATRVFTPSTTVGNAVRVTTRTDQSTGGATPFFFARVLGQNSVDLSASAVATVNPRDIAFVIDLSGSMNNDTDPDNTDGINSTFASQGYPTIGTQLMQQVYADFGFGTFPGTSQVIGQPIGISASSWNPLNDLMSKTGPLSKTTIAAKYRINSSDSSNTRKKKAYSWAMDVQIPALMPAAKPKAASALNSDAYYDYWYAYFEGNSRSLGYRSYVHFMMYEGRLLKPDGVNYVPLSQFSPDCPWHSEATAAGTFTFPPREQPTHAARRAMIAAIKLIKDRNQIISDMNQRDWVSVITFDKLSGGSPAVQVALTGDYDSAMQGCTRLQACEDSVACTATETGLIAAKNHIKPKNQGGVGRQGTNKIVVLLTDGKPNLYSSSSSTISSYIRSNPSSNFYGNQYPQDAALMQTSMMQGDHWYLYPVGIGLGCDYDFMDRMARMGTTDKDGQGPRGSGNPADYEARLTQIFQNIITNPKLRIVQ